MPAMNIITDVPPLEINGRGKPVGGIEPVNTSYCTMDLKYKHYLTSKIGNLLQL